VFRAFNPRNDDSPRGGYDIVFLDPPYRFVKERPADLQRLTGVLAEYYLNPDSTLVFRHDANDALELPGLRLNDRRVYGGMMLEFLSPDVRQKRVSLNTLK
jgi:16S rRNA G966 N2-methylase RsmD